MEWTITALHYLLSDRYKAIAASLLFSVIPLCNWLSHVIIALVTLKHGPEEGGIVLLWSVLPSVVLAMTRMPQLWIYNIFGFYLLGYTLAIFFYYKLSLSKLFQVLLLTGITIITTVHLIYPTINTIWLSQVMQILNFIQVKRSLQVEIIDLPEKVAKIATGLQISLVYIGNLWNVLFAHWVYRKMDKHHTDSIHLDAVRLPFMETLLMISSCMSTALGSSLALDQIPVIFLIGTLSGLSFLSHLAQYFALSVRGYVTFLLFCILSWPYLMIALTILAWTDSLFNLRKLY